MKIGRNKPCPCGSGKKYKRCHGGFAPAPVTDPRLIRALNHSRDRFEAQEHIRQTQQGRGKPIIAATIDQHQMVAVGNKVMFSKGWKTFIDFLSDYLKAKLTPEWGNAEIAKPLNERHTIMQWYDAVCRLQKDSIKTPGEPTPMEMNGVLACYYGLAYALYLIEHNVELQNRMIARLKDRSNFQGAYYELMVARTLIAAGFELTLEDEVDRGSKHCEFAAVSKDSKQKYWIEAKMRSVAGLLGKNETDGTTGKKAENPISHLVTHLHAALRKPASDQRMIFIDLNTEMTADVSDENRPAFLETVNRRIAKYEKEQLESGKTAYIFVTNMTFHRDLLGSPQMVSLPTSLGIPDFNRSGHYRLPEIYRRDQKHADALRVGESLAKLLSFPTTFDGSLPASSLNGEEPPVQIGETYNFEGVGPDGSDLVGEVTEAIVDETAEEAIIAIYTDNKQAHILKQPMTEGQLADYRAHKEAYFGKIKYVPKGIKTPYDMFLFFVQGQRGMKREKLLEYLKMSEEQAKRMSDEDLLLEYCERLVNGGSFFKTVNGVLTSEPREKD
jgi:SEC-C motif